MSQPEREDTSDPWQKTGRLARLIGVSHGYDELERQAQVWRDDDTPPALAVYFLDRIHKAVQDDPYSKGRDIMDPVRFMEKLSQAGLQAMFDSFVDSTPTHVIAGWTPALFYLQLIDSRVKVAVQQQTLHDIGSDVRDRPIMAGIAACRMNPATLGMVAFQVAGTIGMTRDEYLAAVRVLAKEIASKLNPIAAETLYDQVHKAIEQVPNFDVMDPPTWSEDPQADVAVDELAYGLREVEASAARLDTTIGEATSVVERIDGFLTRCGINLAVTGPCFWVKDEATPPADQPGGQPLRHARFLTFGPIAGGHHVHVVEQTIRDGDSEDPSITATTATEWQSCPRDVRLAALPHLTILVGTIADRVNDQADEAESSLGKVRQILDAMEKLAD